MPDRPFKPVIQETRTLVLLAFISIAAYSIAYFSRKEFVSTTYEIKIKAATMMQESMNMLKNIRMEKGVFIDQENDPNETGLVGSQFSLITTDEGDLDAKLTTLDPNFAAAMVELLNRADLVKKDSKPYAGGIVHKNGHIQIQNYKFFKDLYITNPKELQIEIQKMINHNNNVVKFLRK